jgi:50S ribosomal subunit-associated GTPase HflX
MTVEDEMLSVLEARDRAIANLGEKVEQALAEVEAERQQKEEERRQKEAALAKIQGFGQSRYQVLPTAVG